jgi:plasmid stabilization system protein ParE
MEVYEIYDVKINPEAVSDIDEIIENLTNYSAKAALDLHDLIYEMIDGLCEMPKRYPMIRDSFLRSLELRTMFVKKRYVVIYEVKGNKVFVNRVLSAKQEYEKTLRGTHEND